jgi:heme/copper-type cytochrome/quinol oxidase subunit 3
VRAQRGDYSWARHAGVRYTALYWHFLLGAWVALYVTLLASS